MTSENRGQAGRTIRDLDFSGARLHGPNFESARITDAWLLDADISGYIAGLKVNGVEIAPLVEAELDRRSPERVKLRATDPEGLAEAWTMIEDLWNSTIERARQLPEALLLERVDGEWSFVETLRHLILATDRWLLRMVRGEPPPYHHLGLPPASDPTTLGNDRSDTPTLDEVLEVRVQRMREVRRTIEGLTTDELARVCVPPDRDDHPSEEHTVLHCIHVILDEEWEHNRYANRDLDVLASRL